MVASSETSASVIFAGIDSRLRDMVEHAGVGLYAIDIEGRYQFVNRHFAEMLGYASPQDCLQAGLEVLDIFENPNDRETSRERCLRERHIVDYLFKAKRKDGSNLWVSENCSVIREANGEVSGFVGSIADVTSFVEATEKLEAAELDFRRFVERAHEGIYRSSLDGRQLMANPALVKLNGYDSEAEQLEGVKDISVEWYVDPKRREEFIEQLEKNGFVENFESEVYAHKSRDRIWISENAYIVRDDDGAPLFYEGTVRDITEKKLAERQLRKALHTAEEADRAKARFLAHMSHELRTPLNAILGFSDLIRKLASDGMPPEKIVEYSTDIHESGKHLLDLINDVLDLSRIESDAMKVEIEPVDTKHAMETAVEIVRPMALQKSVDLVLETSGAAFLLADPRRLHQCLLNLLSNAIKFSHEGGKVTLQAEATDTDVSLCVTDEGIGIPKELLPTIGQPFVTLDDPTDKAQKGTGLGLTITHSLAKLMKGSMVLDSTLGEGTSVTITLPRFIRD
jgi:PAS domain S-box-containing protein